MAGGKLGRCDDVEEQSVLGQRGGIDGHLERQHLDLECGDDVQTSLCRGQEHLLARRGCIGAQRRLAATGWLDCSVRTLAILPRHRTYVVGRTPSSDPISARKVDTKF